MQTVSKENSTYRTNVAYFIRDLFHSTSKTLPTNNTTIFKSTICFTLSSLMKDFVIHIRPNYLFFEPSVLPIPFILRKKLVLRTG